MNSRRGELVFFEFTVKGVAADSQSAGGLLFVPVAVFKHLFQQLGLVFHDRAPRFDPLGIGFRMMKETLILK